MEKAFGQKVDPMRSKSSVQVGEDVKVVTGSFLWPALATLSELRPQCACGTSGSRDENAARVMLNWLLSGDAGGHELSEVGSGCRVVVKHHVTPLIAVVAA